MEKKRDGVVPSDVEDHLAALLREAKAETVSSDAPESADVQRAMAADSVERMDFLDISRVFESFLAVSGMAMSLISSSGKVLSSANWQSLCSRFYRVHPETRRLCEETDRNVGETLAAASFSSGASVPFRYRCANGLREIAQPLFVEGVHWATIYLGQFLYDDEGVDETALAERARRYGWDEADFLAAARTIPRYSKEEVERTLTFCVAFGDLASKLNYSAYRERRLAQHYLEAERALAEALDQKDILFAELQHRVKNSLTLIASLLSISAAPLEDERARSAFEEAQGRIRSVALLYERLYETRSVNRIDLGAYVKDAARSAIEGLSESDGSIELGTDCAGLQFDTRRAIYVGLIVHELAVNALKHAFPEGGPGRLRVSLRDEGDAILLEAADDGVGLPAGFSFEGRSSIGVLIVRNLAKQLDGSVEIGPGLAGGSGPGAAFAVRFPKKTTSGERGTSKASVADDRRDEEPPC
jgi:two-component sensor histidine kinase/ligand-binding sensor protein